MIWPIERYWHTLRYLKPVQIYGRLWFRLYRPRPDLEPAPPLRQPLSMPVAWVDRPSCMTGPNSFRFLNQDGDLSRGWNSPAYSRLWRYNLHYFDDLNAEACAERRAWHDALLVRWIVENPPGEDGGWEPYPLSLRIVNWIKWFLAGNEPRPEWLHSLAVQVRYLRRRLEYHLLGNHLWANAKALVFAGMFFGGREADGWLAKGLRMLRRELAEQVLPDGGHFERSTMYQAIILEDVLDLLNLFRVYGRQAPEDWPDAAYRMRVWLWTMTHPDGRMALFNDAAFGIAPGTAALDAYSDRLGQGCWDWRWHPVTWWGESGYIRCELGEAVLLLDVAPVGPDYIPGHAHADTLNFEFSLFGQRVIVDSGTSTYEKNGERQRQRGTAAHNTVVVDGADSSEVWGGFRVARRARPFDLTVDKNQAAIKVACSHDGYRRLPGKPVHRRQWLLSEQGLQVLDRVDGAFHKAEARYHFHPEVRVELAKDGTGKLLLSADQTVLFRVIKGRSRLESSTYHPEFNLSQVNKCLVVELADAEAEVRFMPVLGF